MTTPIKTRISKSVINRAYRPQIENMARVQVVYGGSGSGKSRFLAQRVVIDLLRGGRNYLVCRQVGRTIRRSVFNEIKQVVTEWGMTSVFSFNHSELLITCANGYQILFAGLDDTEKIKSITPVKGVITDIWIEEATETEAATVKALLKRQRGGSDKTPKRMTLSFNPIMKTHWIYTDYFAPIAWADDQTEYHSDDLSILKTWYIHNDFLTADDVRDLENEKDDYFYQVYTLGNWGVLGDVIFTNWETRDLTDMREQFTNPRHGLDFGFSADPAALVRTHYDHTRDTIYIYGELYERGLTNDLLAADVKGLIGTDTVTCDSAEPKSIVELTKYGVSAGGAEKGKDSVMHGIQWLQQRRIVVDASCINMRNELTQYQWAKDKDGNSLRRPIDKHNHLIDALRYAYEGDMNDSWWFA